MSTPRQCRSCNSMMKDVRLCLSCHTAHELDLHSNRGHSKIECTNPWHGEGVAAPLEPTRQEFEKWANDPERRLHLDWDGERYELYEVELCWQAYRTAAAVSKNLTTKMERERDAAVVTLRAMCGDNWQSMGRNFAESLASIENEKKRAENLQEELAALRTRWNFALKGEDEALRECRRLEMEIAALREKP